MNKRPNVIIILVDDMGYGDIGYFNNNLTHTPNIDALAESSICFSQAYAGSPVCSPSRAALMTGRYPMRTGVVDTMEWRGLERLALDEYTLGDLFASNGYTTGLIGKWHLGAFFRKLHPMSRGFHETVCFRGGMHDYYDWRLEYNSEIVKTDGTYLTDKWTDEAIQFLKRNKDEAFFLHLAYNAPHTPLQVPEREGNVYMGREGINTSVATLYGMIGRLDQGVGRILQVLKDLHIENNTIIFFTSDNGPQFDNGARHGGAEGSESLRRFNCNLHGEKGTVYEGGIRIPFMVRLPQKTTHNKPIDNMIHFVDVYPTLQSICNLKPIPESKPVDGVDISPLFEGEDYCLGQKRFWQWNRYEPVYGCNTAVRDGDWKLVLPEIPEAMEVYDGHLLQTAMHNPEYFIRNGLVNNPVGRTIPDTMIEPELYNIREDPAEKNNCAGKNPRIVDRLLHSTQEWFDIVLEEYSKASH